MSDKKTSPNLFREVLLSILSIFRKKPKQYTFDFKGGKS